MLTSRSVSASKIDDDAAAATADDLSTPNVVINVVMIGNYGTITHGDGCFTKSFFLLQSFSPGRNYEMMHTTTSLPTLKARQQEHVETIDLEQNQAEVRVAISAPPSGEC